MDIIFRQDQHYITDACKMVIRVSAPFTEDHYCGKGKRPNTELAHNSHFASRHSFTDVSIAFNVLEI
jgi:hypothetical protein